MGMTAANKLRSVVSNVEYVVAIELLAAAQALELRADAETLEGRTAPRLGRGVARALEAVRALAPRLTRDRQLTPDIERVAEAVRRGDFDL